jgi:Fe-S-cluster containining protein
MLFVNDLSRVLDAAKSGNDSICGQAACNCIRCGNCCRVVALSVSFEQTQQDENFPDRDFILKHWRAVKTPDKKLNPEMPDSIFQNFHWFECDLFDSETNLCRDYPNRPDFCRRYPSEFNKKSDFVSANCGFFKGTKND